MLKSRDMIKTKNIVPFIFDKLLSDNTRGKAENIILKLAILSFFIHLAIIYFLKFDFIEFPSNSELLKNPISAAYTPFSFILVYEVYLLIYYLPKSFTTYITKQYEIITLIIIRKLFKDLSALELTADWFEIKGDLQFTYDLVASLVLFYLIYLFQKQGKRKASQETSIKPVIEKFVQKNQGKKIIAVQGLGFVGSVMSLVCANAINGDYAIIGIDLPTKRGKSIINSLNNGIFPLVAADPKIEEFSARVDKIYLG